MNPIIPIGTFMFPPALLSTQTKLEEWIAWAANFSGDWLTSMANKVLRFEGLDATIASSIMSYLTAPVGMVIMLISFLTSFLNKWKNGNEPTIDDIARPMFFLIVADIILTNIGTVVGGLMSLSNLLGDLFISHLPEFKAAFEEEIVEESRALETNELSIIGLVLMFLMSFIGVFMSFVASAMLYVVLLSSKVELMLRFIFAPIGLASIADESKKDDTFRYFKKLLASAFYLVGVQITLQYAMIVGTTKINPPDNSVNVFTDAALFLEVAILQAAIPFSAIGIVSVAKNVVNESFGS